MSGIVFLALVAATATSSTTTRFIGERVPVAIYVASPKGVVSQTSSAEFLAAAAAAVEPDTNLVLSSMEQAGVASSTLDDCPADARVTCWAEAMRPSSARYLWALAVQPLKDGRDRLLTIFMDLESARVVYRTALDSGEAEWRERVESTIYGATARDKGARIDSGNPAQLVGYFEAVVKELLAERFDAAGHWHPYGRLQIDAPRSLELWVDDRNIGRIAKGTTVLTGVLPGLHAVRARTDAGEETTRVTVERERSSRAVFSDALVTTSSVRTSAVYAGIGVAAIGTAIVVWAIARAADGVRAGCLRRNASEMCPSIGGVTFGYDPSAAPGNDVAAVDPSGVVMGPLGAALITTGASWSLGARYVGDRGDAPWWVIATGVAFGAVVYGVGHLALE